MGELPAEGQEWLTHEGRKYAMYAVSERTRLLNVSCFVYFNTVMRCLTTRILLRNASLGDYVVVRTS